MQLRVKKESYQWTWTAKIIFLIVFLLLLFIMIRGAYGFLSPQKTVETKILVVEGWLNDYALEESLSLFHEDSYEMMLITGGPLNTGYVLMDYKSTADVALGTLLELGANPETTIAINRDLVWRDRTYKSALELRKYLKREMPEVDSFNLVSLGAHSKRSYLLFKRAMPEYEIGIISMQERLYDPERWWNTSKGLRTIITEGIGYFYVLFFF